jgi:uncharacterized protein
MSSAIDWRVKVGADETSALYEAGDSQLPLIVCAHGAGGSMTDGAMTRLAAALVSRGMSLVRFNFLYKEKGSGRPDPMPKLEQCFTAVVDHVRREVNPERLVIGGRSMGGRAASMMIAKGFVCDGLLLFAYPLHPAGQPEKLRVAHLPDIKVPVLAFSGTRDALCTPSLMEDALKTVTAPWTMRWIESADHSFHVLKSSGRNDAQVLEGVSDLTLQWISSLGLIP